MSRQLATIHCEVPLDKAPEDMRLGAPDMDALTRLSEQLEIRSLLKGIEPTAAPADDAAVAAPAADGPVAGKPAAEASNEPPAKRIDPVTRNYQTIVTAAAAAPHG